MENITKYSDCTGCAACYNICPTKSIIMKENEEGFRHPVIDNNKCVNCRMCSNICPVNRVKTDDNKKKENVSIVFQNRKNNRMISTSGGFFYAIAEYVINNNGLVVGVGFDEDLVVCHIPIEDIENINSLTGSKYVQSRVDEAYRSVLDSLNNMRMTLFVGTPCQIAGINAFLEQKRVSRENLYLLELKCYGVPSPGLFKKYVRYIETQYDNKISNINFRDKQYGYAASTVRVDFSDLSSVINKYDIKSYSKTFFSGLNMRQSCYNCKFRNIEYSKADFIVGDFNQFKNIEKKWDDDLGTSLVILNSEKSKILDKLKDSEYEIVKLDNGDDRRNPIKPYNRDDFFKDNEKMEWNELCDKYCPQSKKDILATYIKPIIAKIPFAKHIFKFIKLINTRGYINKSTKI